MMRFKRYIQKDIQDLETQISIMNESVVDDELQERIKQMLKMLQEYVSLLMLGYTQEQIEDEMSKLEMF